MEGVNIVVCYYHHPLPVCLTLYQNNIYFISIGSSRDQGYFDGIDMEHCFTICWV